MQQEKQSQFIQTVHPVCADHAAQDTQEAQNVQPLSGAPFVQNIPPVANVPAAQTDFVFQGEQNTLPPASARNRVMTFINYISVIAAGIILIAAAIVRFGLAQESIKISREQAKVLWGYERYDGNLSERAVEMEDLNYDLLEVREKLELLDSFFPILMALYIVAQMRVVMMQRKK